MKKILTVLFALVLLVACSTNVTNKEIEPISIETNTEISIKQTSYDSLVNYFESVVKEIDTNYFFNNRVLHNLLKIYPGAGKYFFDNTIYPWIVSNYVRDRGKTEEMFPFSNFDKAILYKLSVPDSELYKYPYVIDFKNYERTSKIKLFPDLPKERLRTMNEQEINQILRIYNQPLNFGWGECGTSFTDRFILFYSRDEIVATLVFGCDFGSLHSYPKNYRSKFGGMDCNECRDELKEMMKTIENNTYK